MRLRGKRMFVTAAGQGIGRASALMFAKEGSSVLATDINAEFQPQLDGQDGVRILRLDVTNADAIKTLTDAEPAFDTIFNCAGFVHHGSISITGTIKVIDGGWSN